MSDYKRASHNAKANKRHGDRCGAAVAHHSPADRNGRDNHSEGKSDLVNLVGAQKVAANTKPRDDQDSRDTMQRTQSGEPDT